MSNFVEGLYYVFLFIIVLYLIWGPVVLAVLYWLLNQTTNRIHQIIILAVALIAGYFMMMNQGVTFIVESIIFIAPIAVFIPLYTLPALNNPKPAFGKIFCTYVVVALISGILLPFFSLPNLLNAPLIYGYYPLSMSRIFPWIVVIDTVIAFIIQGISHYLDSLPPIKIEDS